MLNADLLISLVTLALAAVVYLQTRDLSRLGGVFVNYVLVAMTALAILVLIKGFVKPEKITFFKSTVERNNVAVGILFLGLYLVLLPLIGFLPASYLFYFVFNLYLGDDRLSLRSVLLSVVLTAVVVTGFYLIFHHFLEVPLPEGRWLMA
ncbi:MAG: tripartite tricarboxylate transporter TctB family protein [Desulfosarcinaceae bacterium]|nr:tripartite tricarboxylate transporter TctB family protein [Desulfosarcinaceae bacterium]